MAWSGLAAGMPIPLSSTRSRIRPPPARQTRRTPAALPEGEEQGCGRDDDCALDHEARYFRGCAFRKRMRRREGFRRLTAGQLRIGVVRPDAETVGCAVQAAKGRLAGGHGARPRCSARTWFGV